MTQYALPAMYALFVWWFGTGVALYIVGRARETHRWSMLGAIAVFSASLYGLAHVGEEASGFGVYAAFTLAILVWGAIEVSFLTGIVAGPFRGTCPPGCEPWLRATYAIGAILWHELLLIATGAAIIAITWEQPNQFGAWTFALLWVMRLSTKLNLFLGVPILNDQLLPESVAHLRSYFRKKPVSRFFPVSVTLATILTILLAEGSMLGGRIQVEGMMLLATLSALAVLEHWFMVLPIPIERMWNWSLSTGNRSGEWVSVPSAMVIARAVDGRRGQTAFESRAAPVTDMRRPRTSEADGTEPTLHDNIYPHPVLAKNGRRP